MNSLVDFARASDVISLTYRQGPLEYEIGEQPYAVEVDDVLVPLPKRKYIEPDELGDFRRFVSAFKIFPGDVEGPIKRNTNGWTTLSTDDWLWTTVNGVLVHSDDEAEGADPYLSRVFLLSQSDMDGLIGVDTHPERLGWIGYYWYQGNMSDGRYPVIAHSFREWLERTVKAGPDVLYWEQDDFVDLGPALPNDPYYRGPNDR